ncbi:MAG: glycosyltransferase [Thermoleophilaceae bacterium]|nr:glycosyltransferase [Thermoleophilaceae bacterium]
MSFTIASTLRFREEIAVLGSRLKAQFAHALDRRFARLDSQIEDLRGSLDAESARRTAAEKALQDAIAALDQSVNESVNGELRGMVRSIAAEEPRNRRALYELRDQPSYELAFTELNPLVSICIQVGPERLDLLMERSLPSALGQTYKNIEVVVVGNAVGEEIRLALEELDDDRVSFYDLTQSVVFPNPHRRWLNDPTLLVNEALHRARGRWVTEVDDDDAIKPDAVQALLEVAQAGRLEVVYGYAEQHAPDQPSELIYTFPPRPIEPDWQEKGFTWQPWDGTTGHGALCHAGLRIIGREHVSGEMGMPCDHFRLANMVRAGVRFGMIEQPTYDYYPTTLWGKNHELREL